MSRAPVLLVVDAYSTPDALFPADGAPPAILDTLRSLDADTDPPPLAPVIVCQEAEAARARGAFIVSDDPDGVVIVPPQGLARDALKALAAAFAWRQAASCDLRLARAGAMASGSEAITPQLVCEGTAFHESQLKGCLVPSEWLMLAIRTGDLL